MLKPNCILQNTPKIFLSLLLYSFILLVPLVYCEKTFNLKDLRSNPIGVGSTQDFIRVNLGISENNPNTRIVNYVDLNNDKLIDMIGVKKEGIQERPVFFIYDKDEGKFYPKEVTGVHYENAFISNILTNDFNHDEMIDMMVTFNYLDKNSTSTQILLYDPSTAIYKKVYEFPNTTESNIMMGDFGETRGVDFLFFDAELGTRKVLSFDDKSNPKIRNFEDMISKDLNICDRSIIHTKYKFSSPHSSAFVDIDGDCLNDILIRSLVEEEIPGTNSTRTKYFLEIWRGIIEDQKIKYCLSQSSVYDLEPNLGPFSIADINRDSMPDIIFPILQSYPPKIIIGYNQINLEYDWTADYCETHNKFIVKNLNNTFSYLDIANIKIPLVFDELRQDNQNSNLVKTITLTHLATQTFYHTEKFPALLRFGDINMDSYPDFTIILYDKSDFSQNSYVFLNSDDSVKNSEISTRSFSYSHTYFNPYINNAVYSSFFDLDEDGKLDIVVAYQEANKIINTAGFYNTYVYDNYYLKSFVLNQKNTLFQYEIGVQSRYITTNLDGSRRMDFSSQAVQVSTPLSLHLPYSYVGIGRSNNYIENFHVISGKYIRPNENYKIFTPIIPNSQIIIRHIEEEVDANLTSSGNSETGNSTNTNIESISSTQIDWYLDLIVKPTSNLPIIISMIVFILVCMCVAIVYLHMKEVKEDSVENQDVFMSWFDSR